MRHSNTTRLSSKLCLPRVYTSYYVSNLYVQCIQFLMHSLRTLLLALNSSTCANDGNFMTFLQQAAKSYCHPKMSNLKIIFNKNYACSRLLYVVTPLNSLKMSQHGADGCESKNMPLTDCTRLQHFHLMKQK